MITATITNNNVIHNMSENSIHDTPVVCVTGSSKRIGACVVKHLHNHGFNVIIHCNKSIQAAKALAHELNTCRENSAKVVYADLTKIDTLDKLAHEIKACFGRLDVLIHNASRFFQTDFENNIETSISQWHELFATNAQAPLILSTLLHETLQHNNGCIISMLDIHAHDKPFPKYTMYTMAKAAHRAMVKSLAYEFAPHVRVNAIAPGANIWPEQETDQSIATETQLHITKSIPLQKVGTPEDVAKTALYLIQAQYVTGHVLDLDGGRSLTLAGM